MNPQELLRIERDREGGEFRIWLNGRRHDRVDDISDERLRVLLQGLLALLAPGQSGVSVEVEVRPEQRLSVEFNGSFLTRLRESLWPRAYAGASGAAEARTDAVGGQAATSAAGDIWAQINAILQRRWREQPGLPEVEISGEGGVLQIRVGEQSYQKVEDVPDETIRALIRAAVGEWEAQ